MTTKRPWYRLFTTPSQIFLVVSLASCLFFAVGLFRQLDRYMAHRLQLQVIQARQASLAKTAEDLSEFERNVELEKEGRIRERRDARPYEYVLEVPPGFVGELQVEQAATLTTAPIWEQWWGLFFGRD